MKLQKVSLEQKFALFEKTWVPQIIGEMNDLHVKIVKLHGEFIWHHHDEEDELFLVTEGAIDMHYRDHDGNEQVERFGPGEFLIVPRGVEHKPVARDGAKLVLIEPKTTRNTGTAGGARTVEPAWI
jgi:mannose-6-phosphate isomerase-like protein (cupin superfamily)